MVEVTRGLVGREGGDIRGEDGDQLQTTERPSYILDHISTDDSVTTCDVYRSVRFPGEFVDVKTVLLYKGHPAGALRVFHSVFSLRFLVSDKADSFVRDARSR